MPYAFDPEIAAVVPLVPDIEGTDPAASRAFLSELIAQLPAPDTTGVRYEDRA
jgi:acetyl esterase